MKAEEKEAENIRVAVRCRPMNERETREQATSCFTCGADGAAVLTNLENPSERHEFGFDFVYGCDSAQEQVFADIGVPLLDRAFGGYNGTIFAYGQTGSGKTFSMTGVPGGGESLEGLIPRMNRAIFERVARETSEHEHKRFLVECSFFEIYNEIIYDLLDVSGNGKKHKGGLEIKEHSVLGIYVKDLQERVVSSRAEVVELMAQGSQARTVGYTQMNSESSRSHSIFTIKIHQKDEQDESKSLFAKINLVDLAGSERAASTGAQGDRLREGANINKSLSALGNVINALVEASRAGKKVFIPYRNSKLTRVLQESLGGNSLCSMLATLSPANINFPETLSTLKYASRAKSIKVNAKKNEANSQISQLNDEIAALKQRLAEQMEAAPPGLDPREKDEIVRKYEKQIQEMDRIRLQTWEDKARLSKQHELERKKLARERALADQRIRDERTKKWRLLQDKGDLELMMRALRDLDGGNNANANANGEVVSSAGQWLDTAQRMRAMETEAKDLRTLIQVFRDSLHKDVELWAKRCGVTQDAKAARPAPRREDSSAAAAAHMTASQMGSKLHNISDETDKLLALETQLVHDRSALINAMARELLELKTRRSQLKTDLIALQSTKPAPAAASVQAVRDQQQILEERERGLAITLTMVRGQRTALVAAIAADRHRVFDLEAVTKQFISYADQQVVVPTSGDNSQRQERWDEAKKALLSVSQAWQQTQTTTMAADTGGGPRAEYIAQGETTALGLESRMLPDECISVSSRPQDAKLARLNGEQSWTASGKDTTPTLVLDFELPRIFDSISLRGGVVQPDANPASTPASRAVTPAGRPPTSTFILPPAAELQAVRDKYKLEEISGTHEATYELLARVMSWPELLRTDVVPTKLFARPPVRFLHDVLSAVMRNTGFAHDALTPAQLDYAQLTSKTERAEYLTALVDFVQAWYQRRHTAQEGSAPVVIAATASNILAGKEPTDTLKFLGFFALAAMEHAATSEAKPKEAVVAGQQSSEDSNNTTGPEVDDGGQLGAESGPTEGWATRIRVSSSFTGAEGDWRVLGEFDANSDAQNIDSIALGEGSDSGSARAGRYLQLTCLKWHKRAVLQCEVFGREAQESDTLALGVQAVGEMARALLGQLRQAAALALEDAKSGYERAKLVESEKHAQLASLGEELTKLRAASAAGETQARELREAQTQLTTQLEAATQRGDREQTRAQTLQQQLTQVTEQTEELKRRSDALQSQLGEQEHQVQTLTMQLGEQKRTAEAAQQTRQQLEELVANLRGQLANKEKQDNVNQQEGQAEISALSGELMTTRVQLDEQKRALADAELRRQEQEAFGQQQHTLLQQARAALVEKEAETDAKLKARAAEGEAALQALRDERDDIKQVLERALAAESTLKVTASELETQRSALEAELETWRRRAESAETELQMKMSATSAGEEAGEAGGDHGESTENAQDTEKLLLEAQTNELRRLAELEKLEAKVQSLESTLAEREDRACAAAQELEAVTQRVRELEEADEELQLQLQVVTDERDSARQKEEQLFAENNEKEQEIERIRDGYVWVTDRMNSKEDELSELQEQLERYQSLLEMTGGKSAGGDVTPVRRRASNADIGLTKLYALAIGTGDADAATNGDAMLEKLSAWIERMKRLAERPPSNSEAPVEPAGNTPPPQHPEGGSVPTAVAATAPAGEEDTDYDDDFDDVEEGDEGRKARRKASAAS